MNKISELQARQGNVEVEGTITEKQPERTFEKFGKSGRVCNATLKDDSGSVKVTLWNEQVDQVSVGSTVHITNGYVGEWQGELQLSTGKFGALEVKEGGSTPAASGDKPPEEPAPEDFEAGKGEAVIDSSISEEETI